MLGRANDHGVAADGHAFAKLICIPFRSIGIIRQKRLVKANAIVGDQLGGLDPFAVDAFVYVGCAGIEGKPSGGG